jgi:hypothetical protein
MKRLAILCVAIVFALVVAVVTSNQSAKAGSFGSFPQDPFSEDPNEPVAQTQGSQTETSQAPMTETEAAVTQGSDTKGTSQRGFSSSDRVPFENKFWRYLSANNYKNWAPVPGQSGDFTAGQRPHGNLVKLYLNRTAAGNPAALPVGSIIVTENYTEDQSLQAITVMYKNAGYNPGHGDWYWVQYNPDGSVAISSPEAGSMKLAGRVNACIECHAGAGGADFVFFND